MGRYVWTVRRSFLQGLVREGGVTCDDPLHLWEIEDDEPTPRYAYCLCGEHTWGEMDDLLMLTDMWERS